MEATSANENPPKDFNKIDLSQLQDFSFGTQWAGDKTAPGHGSGARPARREGGEGDTRFERPGDPRRDRRGFRRPAGESGDQAARPEGFRGEPRRDHGPGGGPRGGRPMRSADSGGRPQLSREPRVPYLSPYFDVVFYPEDTGFAAMAKAMRASCRTYELFDIAKLILGKSDRFVIVVQPKPRPDAAPAQLHVAAPDGVPFESEEAAIAHVLATHLGKFFDTAEAEIEPPKGNFLIINRCPVTGELLGPPNYHRYAHIVQQHHAAKVGRMPFEAYRSRIESVRDPAVVAQWLEKMKKVTRYTWKLAPAGEAAPQFDSLEEARQHLLTQARDQVVKAVDSARFHAKVGEVMPSGEIRRAIEGQLERQRRFPLDTANALRGRLRREGFTIFKKGSKGVSYVSAVKRKFRVPGQVFSDSITALITFIERNALTPVSGLPAKFLGIDVAAAMAAAPLPEGTSASQAPFLALPAEQGEKLRKMNNDLRWLVAEGYVTEFADGRLFAPPPLTQPRRKTAEGEEENDLENFPEPAGLDLEPVAEAVPEEAAAASERTPAPPETPPSSPAAAPEAAAPEPPLVPVVSFEPTGAPPAETASEETKSEPPA